MPETGPENPGPAMNVGGGDDSDAERQARTALACGDPNRALEVLMTAYGKLVYRYCFRMMVDSDLANDVLQTTFLQAFEGCRQFDGRSSMRAWLFGIARHRCLDALKSRRRKQRRFEALDTVQEPVDPAQGLEEEAASNQRRIALQGCIGQLEVRTRDAVLLRFDLGLSYTEMATMTQERAPALQARVSRAMPVLRRCMERKGMRP
jgi:RNA polymerase sigma factor (sigma-70 family)